MIINADSLLPHLKEKVRPTQSDTSRHLICPTCDMRTRLLTLGDGRRKCTVCGKKFRIHKVTEKNKLQQCAEILLCFCIDFSAQKTASITGHRYRLVATYYDHFRRLLAEKSLSPEQIQLFTAHKGNIEVIQSASRCRFCKSKIRSDAASATPPVFGVQLRDNGEVVIDPLSDDEAMSYFHSIGSKGKASGHPATYAGFICCGKLHHSTTDTKAKDAIEELFAWIEERIQSQRTIWKRNTGYSLKEIEWKYNNRSLHPDLQARKLIDLMPVDFLTSW